MLRHNLPQILADDEVLQECAPNALDGLETVVHLLFLKSQWLLLVINSCHRFLVIKKINRCDFMNELSVSPIGLLFYALLSQAFQNFRKWNSVQMTGVSSLTLFSPARLVKRIVIKVVQNIRPKLLIALLFSNNRGGGINLNSGFFNTEN